MSEAIADKTVNIKERLCHISVLSERIQTPVRFRTLTSTLTFDSIIQDLYTYAH